MSTNKTSNFGLNQWEPGDQVLREEFNADNLKIDQVLGEKGNCQIICGSYTGSGSFGYDAQNHLKFSITPMVIFVGGQNRHFWAAKDMHYTDTHYYVNSPTSVYLTWSDKSVSWVGTNAETQLNKEGQTYFYVALLSNQ